MDRCNMIVLNAIHAMKTARTRWKGCLYVAMPSKNLEFCTYQILRNPPSLRLISDEEAVKRVFFPCLPFSIYQTPLELICFNNSD